MKQFITSILILIFIISCTSNTIYKKPEDLISKDKMVDLLVDMQIALGAKTTKNKDGNSKVEYMHLVYDKHGVDSARFSTSNFYYTTDIDQYNDILKEVKSRLDTMLEKYEEEEKLKDSLERISKSNLKEKSLIDEKPKKVFRDTSFVK